MAITERKGEKQLLLAPPCDAVLLGLAATFSFALGSQVHCDQEGEKVSQEGGGRERGTEGWRERGKKGEREGGREGEKMEWKEVVIKNCSSHLYVGCMVQTVTVDTPVFWADCLPCEALGIDARLHLCP